MEKCNASLGAVDKFVDTIYIVNWEENCHEVAIYTYT